MTQHWTDRLSEYVDCELSFTERVAIERHLAECAACRDIVADLRVVVAAAESLPDVPPANDLWQGIADRIAPHDIAPVTTTRRIDAIARRRVSFTVPQLIAASVALIMLSGAGVFLTVRGDAGPARTAAASSDIRQVDSRTGESYYDAAIRDLEAALERSRDSLDPATVEVIEANIRIIDRAIFDARTALERDPSNLFLNRHLEETMKRKVELLKRATSMS